MYSAKQRKAAIDTFIRFDHSYADTIAELGYPSSAALRMWWKEYEKTGQPPQQKKRESAFNKQQMKTAVAYYLKHGKNLSRTRRALGYPKSNATLAKWIDELARGKRKVRKTRAAPMSAEEKIEAVVALEARTASAQKVAEDHGVSRHALYAWRRQILDDNDGDREERKGAPVSKEYDDLPDDLEQLEEMLRQKKKELRRVQLELDVRQATLEIVKKDQGTDPNRLSNAEKAMLIEGLRTRYRLCELLQAFDMAKSSYEYARGACARGESEERAAARQAVVDAFSASNGTYGYRRVLAALKASGSESIGEWTVRAIMGEEKLIARTARRRRRYSSYEGEISKAPDNLLRDEKGKHHFRADAPNEKWITDVTEFHIPAGKVYLSPIVDCFDGMPLAWSISTSPDAQMANSSLSGACEQLKEDDHPVIHSDRGCHYRWPGWIDICEERGLVRSMSRKGCSPDNSRAEGFFGRLKIEFFYERDWTGISIEEFMARLDAYLVWYRDTRLKSDLGYKSPMQYREELGLVA